MSLSDVTMIVCCVGHGKSGYVHRVLDGEFQEMEDKKKVLEKVLKDKRVVTVEVPEDEIELLRHNSKLVNEKFKYLLDM